MRSKVKKFAVIFGLIFLIVLGFLTYFSSTIEYMLMPRVSIANIESGTVSGKPVTEQGVCLVPVNSVIEEEGIAEIFIIYPDEDGTGCVIQSNVMIRDRNELYCEVQIDPIYVGYFVIYETSKDLFGGEKAVVED